MAKNRMDNIKALTDDRADWKFIITIIVGALGAAVPLWSYYTDSHSLRVQIVSKTPLQPSPAHALPELTISLGGQELEKPYLTIFEIVNDGGSPVRADAFESPLEIKTQDGVKITGAEVTVVTPNDLQPKIERGPNLLRLQPLLLNPSDSIRIAFITSGGIPEFSLRGRIEGVTLISVEDMGVKLSERRTWIQASLGVALLIVYFVNLLGAVKGKPLRRGTMAFASLSSLFAAVFFLLRY